MKAHVRDNKPKQRCCPWEVRSSQMNPGRVAMKQSRRWTETEICFRIELVEMQSVEYNQRRM